MTKVNPQFKQFVDSELLPRTQLESNKFWSDFDSLIREFSPRNADLLETRVQMQSKIDNWHRQNDPSKIRTQEYPSFLKSIRYIEEQGPEFSITTSNVDVEIASIAGPQLVVPLKNARFALNAANARWGSLYDSLYGSDIIPDDDEETPSAYDPRRGSKVIAYVREFFDECFPLEFGSHHDAVRYRVEDEELKITLKSDIETNLKYEQQFVAYLGPQGSPTSIVLKNHGLHLEIKFDENTDVGRSDKAHISDVIAESAITTIMDCEDSVAAVDSEDKIEVYRNWLGLMTGTLNCTFEKGGNTVVRKLNKDRKFITSAGEELILPGKSLLFNRNVGLLMKTDLLRNANNEPVPEGIVDAVIISLGGLIDLQSNSGYTNSAHGSIYLVKPKLHGPEEVKFSCELFAAVEDMLKLPDFTLKIGIMDEERRTTVNLRECIRQAKERLVFINTGFLDRTGDEISTSMQAGAFLPKEQIKLQPWIRAYEAQNVQQGLRCGLSGRGQIGKGMWAMPEEMKKMMEAKISHPLAGANTAWVPSPTAATLHALHYHKIDVFQRQKQLQTDSTNYLDDILDIPLLASADSLSDQEIQAELDNNIQGILGYVVRWVEMGIGCSKVPDINNIELMEDRATLRISAIHIANWLQHGICNDDQVNQTLIKMASIVDAQNSSDPQYKPMSDDFDKSPGFQAAKSLIFENAGLPNGYTEPLLHEYRAKAKLQ